MPLPVLIILCLLGLCIVYSAIGLAAQGIAHLARGFGILPTRPVYGTPRSGKWPAIRRKHLALHPHCAACGTLEEVEPHHVLPFHVDESRELDPDNLVSLCNKHGCHFAFGHNYDWHAFNPHVREDVVIQSRRVLQRKYQ